jgi:S1-C subfamily serine protease
MLMRALCIILAAALTISDAFIVRSAAYNNQRGILFISSGFSFSDGQQILVSAQRPLGIVLEQDETPGDIVVTSVDSDGSAAGAGVKEGDILLAVQNASVQNASLDEVLAFIGNAPRVVNMRFLRRES